MEHDVHFLDIVSIASVETTSVREFQKVLIKKINIRTKKLELRLDGDEPVIKKLYRRFHLAMLKAFPVLVESTFITSDHRRCGLIYFD